MFLSLYYCFGLHKKTFSSTFFFFILQDLSDLHADALHVVANCLSDSESVQLIHKGGGLTRLMDFLLTPNVPEIQANAVKCIARVAQNRKLERD